MENALVVYEENTEKNKSVKDINLYIENGIGTAAKVAAKATFGLTKTLLSTALKSSAIIINVGAEEIKNFSADIKSDNEIQKLSNSFKRLIKRNN